MQCVFVEWMECWAKLEKNLRLSLSRSLEDVFFRGSASVISRNHGTERPLGTENVMEDQSNHTLQGPHWHPRLADAPPDFTPLRLVIEGGELTLLLDRPEMIVGRHSDADLRLPLPDVSRRHCRFAWNAGRWQVFDLSSLNGLWVNDRQVQQAVLEHGDRLRIGGFSFVVHLISDGTDVGAQRSLYNVFQSLPPDGESPRRLAS
jgi:hypothetical protein